MRHKTLRQSGKTLKEAKNKLETQVHLYCSRGWECDGNLSIKVFKDCTKGKSRFTVYQKIIK